MKLHLFVMAIFAFAAVAKADTNEWTEVCSSCGKTTFHYAYSFDTNDYEVISFLMKDKIIQENYILAHAPHGPTPSCDSHFIRGRSGRPGHRHSGSENPGAAGRATHPALGKTPLQFPAVCCHDAFGIG